MTTEEDDQLANGIMVMIQAIQRRDIVGLHYCLTEMLDTVTPAYNRHVASELELKDAIARYNEGLPEEEKI